MINKCVPFIDRKLVILDHFTDKYVDADRDFRISPVEKIPHLIGDKGLQFQPVGVKM
jgi:hypothetical protein